MYRFLEAVALFGFLTPCLTKTVTYDWSIGWVNAAPDNFSRPVIGINGNWPLPKLEADLGDTVVVHVHNNLGNETTGIHWHGQFQVGTANMDGPIGVSQCAIIPGSSYTYTFVANPAGSSWYHSHASGQYPDGLRGPLVIHDRAAEWALGFDQEYTLTMSDWYHSQAPPLVHYYLSQANNDDNDGSEPIPDSSIINDKLTETFDIAPGKKYLIRLIGMSALASHFVQFEDHNMTVVAIDGVQVVPAETESVYVTMGQRYDVLITGKTNPKKNYAFVASMDPSMFDSVPATLNLNSDGVLQYSKQFPAPSPLRPASFSPINDFGLTPLDEMPLLRNPDKTVNLVVNFTDYSFGQRASLGPDAYVTPKVPTLYTALTTGNNALDPRVYGAHVSPFVFKYGEIIEIVINNLDTGGHPFHLHGHVFQVVVQETTQPWNGDTSHLPDTPMRRDTAKVAAGGSMVLRYKADNPGVFLFHCHIDWHVDAGLSVTFVEAPLELQQQFPNGIPSEQKDLCKQQGIPTEGNCAGNTRDVFNTTNCNSDLSANTWGALVNPPSSRRRSKRMY